MSARFTKIGATALDDLEQFPMVQDATTGLMWDRRESARVNWQQASDHVAKLNAEKFGGYDDWQLPTLEQLETLHDVTRVSPAIDQTYFPNCRSDWYWSITPYAGSPGGYAWNVNFSDGSADWGNRDDGGFVRAVRVGQLSAVGGAR